MKNQKGITLVALVITIIVLLILAGISISLVVGQNGVLGKATNAVNANEKATVEQEVKLAVADGQMAYYDEWVTNQAVEKVGFYYDSTWTKTSDNIYKGNCTSAKEVYIANSSTNVYVKYITNSNDTYYVTITVPATGNITVSDATQTDPAGSASYTQVK